MTSSNVAKVKTPIDRRFNKGKEMTKEEQLARELKKCAGKYVAVKNYKVIGCANSALKAKELAEKKNVKDAAIFSVPDPKLGHHFF